MLHDFYDECASGIWERDGIVNKFIGDAVLAIFNFPIVREDHVRQADRSDSGGRFYRVRGSVRWQFLG
jgi:adenylate cyclase